MENIPIEYTYKLLKHMFYLNFELIRFVVYPEE